MAIYIPHVRLSRPLRFGAGEHPVPGGFGGPLAAAMTVESIYFAANDLFAGAASALLLGNLLLAALLGLWLEARARRPFGFAAIWLRLWLQVTVQCAILLSYMPVESGETPGEWEWVAMGLISAAVGAAWGAVYAFVVQGTFGVALGFATAAGCEPPTSPQRGLAVRGVWRASAGAVGLCAIAAVPEGGSGLGGVLHNPGSVLVLAEAAVLLVIGVADLADRAGSAAAGDRVARRRALWGDLAAIGLCALALTVHALWAAP